MDGRKGEESARLIPDIRVVRPTAGVEDLCRPLANAEHLQARDASLKLLVDLGYLERARIGRYTSLPRSARTTSRYHGRCSYLRDHDSQEK